MPPILRPAEPRDYATLFSFMNSLSHMHRHLDWRDTLEWLGRQPFLVCEEDNQIQAALACPPEPPEVAWVRLFARALEDLRTISPRPAIVSLALREWYEELLKRNGFIHHQDIVVFLYDT